jgi:hypothetical protein
MLARGIENMLARGTWVITELDKHQDVRGNAIYENNKIHAARLQNKRRYFIRT